MFANSKIYLQISKNVRQIIKISLIQNYSQLQKPLTLNFITVLEKCSWIWKKMYINEESS